MALSKVTYVSKETKVSAKNLNDIQDEIIANEKALKEKVSKEAGKGLSTNDFTAEEKSKLQELSNYVHPDNAQIRHVTDAEKTKWNGYESLITQLSNKIDALQQKVDEAHPPA